jgi:hypothetical protein
MTSLLSFVPAALWQYVLIFVAGLMLGAHIGIFLMCALQGDPTRE